jgi:hypothetical protein
VIRSFPEARIMIATGLHQDAHDHVTFYWRLREHEKFLDKVRVPFRSVEPRMSRDFVIDCVSVEQAAEAERRLRRIMAADGTPLFEVDNRGSDLFVMLAYSREIGPQFEFLVDGERHDDLAGDVAFVALKNGEHNGVGYFLDTAASHDVLQPQEFPLSELQARVMGAFGLAQKPRESMRAVVGSA